MQAYIIPWSACLYTNSIVTHILHFVTRKLCVHDSILHIAEHSYTYFILKGLYIMLFKIGVESTTVCMMFHIWFVSKQECCTMYWHTINYHMKCIQGSKCLSVSSIQQNLRYSRHNSRWWIVFCDVSVISIIIIYYSIT